MISRDPLDLVTHAIGPNHQYPDGLVLFLGTMFAPTKDRLGPGRASRMRSATSSPSRRRSSARSSTASTTPTRSAPWTFGAGALMQQSRTARPALTRSLDRVTENGTIDAPMSIAISSPANGSPARPPTANRNPSNVGDVIGEYAQADAAQARAAIAAAKRAFPAWAAGSIQERSNILDRVGTRNPRAQGRARPPPVARGRQDAARRRRRGGARRAHLQVLRRRGAAPRRREAAVGAPGHRRRGDARAGRRRRPHHAVELSDRDSGVEDRAGARVRQHGRVQARRSRARMRVGAGRNPGEGGHSRRRVQPGDGTRLGRRRGAGERSRRRGDQLHGLGRHRPRASPRRRSRGWRSSSSRWAARTRSSCWTTPTCATAVNAAAQGAYLLDRPALHGVVAAHRHRRAFTTASSRR